MKFADVICGQKRALALSHPDVSIYHDLQEGALDPRMVMLSVGGEQREMDTHLGAFSTLPSIGNDANEP